MTERQQEQVMGVTREHHLESSESNSSSHYTRMKAADAEGKPVQLINQSMPFGDLHDQGIIFVSCASSANAFKTMLHSRVFGDENGDYDRLLDFMVAETGAAFFAPSIEFIKQQAKLS
jgi:putative iron-dependent peroxidase